MKNNDITPVEYWIHPDGFTYIGGRLWDREQRKKKRTPLSLRIINIWRSRQDINLQVPSDAETIRVFLYRHALVRPDFFHTSSNNFSASVAISSSMASCSVLISMLASASKNAFFCSNSAISATSPAIIHSAVLFV